MNRRPIAKLREPLERRLTAYALAASASGVGLLLWPQPAAARIVYTKADDQLQINTPLQVDLNHDGIVDFLLDLSVSSYGGFDISVTAERTNQVAGYCRHLSQGCWASALHPNARVGDNRRFGPYNYMLFAGCSGTTCEGYGPWNGVQNRYLGFQFLIKGKVHYGWARLNVSINPDIVAVLTGYAYETVPNKPLVTGRTKGTDAITEEPRTLGHLARGASVVGE